MFFLFKIVQKKVPGSVLKLVEGKGVYCTVFKAVDVNRSIWEYFVQLCSKKYG